MAARKAKNPAAASPRSVCVIGAGLGGLALALRLQGQGYAVTLVEARAAPGGLIRRVVSGGMSFEEGPGELGDLGPWRDLAAAAGCELSALADLREIAPAWRFYWRDRGAFDLVSEAAEQARQLGRLAPNDIAGFEDLQRWYEAARADAWQRLAEVPLEGPMGLLSAVQPVLRVQGWRSVWSHVANLIESEPLREALSFPALLSGANPFASSALTLLGQPAPGRPAWWPLGGVAMLMERLLDRFSAMGGIVRMHDPVTELELVGNRVSAVITQSGWREHFAAVASNADIVHTYRDLLARSPRGAQALRRLSHQRFAPSAITVHFALAGSWPGIPHNAVLFASRYRELLGDVFDVGVLPQDGLILLSHPSITDPGLAPAGTSLFRAVLPVAHLGKLPVDWDALAPLVAGRVIDEVGRRLIPDIRDRIVAQTVTTPRDLALDLGLHLGSGWSLEPTMLQSIRRPAHRDPKLANFYLVGAATQPGAGLAGVLAGAKAAALQLVRDHP
ncbi:MAG: phytoene desaturase family protein [Novosphingobium sp.]